MNSNQSEGGVRAARLRTRLGVGIVVALGTFLLYAHTIDGVPFHPDEATWLHMSAETDLLLQGNVRALIWQGEAPLDEDTTLRMLNAPVPKYLFRLATVLAHGRSKTALWDWFKSFDDNRARGAVPHPDVLRTARLTVAGAAAISLALFCLATWHIAGPLTAAIATLLLATHPLEFLHLRRAMAEGVVQMCSMAAFLAVLRLDKTATPQRWVRLTILVGIACGIAVASKQSALPLILVAMTVVVLSARHLPVAPRLRAGLARRAVLVVALTSLATFYVLNPAMYRHPIISSAVMVGARFRLASVDAERAKPTPTFISRVQATAFEVFIRPPAFEEVPFYIEDVEPARSQYQTSHLYRFWDTSLVRIAFFAAAVTGMWVSVRWLAAMGLALATLPLIALIEWLILQVAFGLLFYPMDWQRYVVPLVPPLCFLAAVGLTAPIRWWGQATARRGDGERPAAI